MAGENEEVLEDEEEGQEVTPASQSQDEWPEGLPEEWKGKSPAEISRIWQTAATMLDSKDEQLKAMKQQMESATSRPPDPPPVQEEEEVDLKALVFDDPVKAVEIAGRKLFGPQVERINTKLASLAMMEVEREYPDFAKYKDTVKQIVSAKQGEIEAQDVRAAYLMARGFSAVQAEQEEASRIHNEPPSPPEPSKKKPEIPELGKAIMSRMGFESEEEMDEWLSAEDVEMEVPRGDF